MGPQLSPQLQQYSRLAVDVAERDQHGRMFLVRVNDMPYRRSRQRTPDFIERILCKWCGEGQRRGQGSVRGDRSKHPCVHNV